MKTKQCNHLKMIITTMCLLFLFACGGAEDNSPEAVAINFMRATLNQDIEKIIPYFHSEIRTKIEKENKFATFKKSDFAEKNGLDVNKDIKLSMTDCQKHNEFMHVRIKAEITNTNINIPEKEREESFLIILKQEDEKWKVCAIMK